MKTFRINSWATVLLVMAVMSNISKGFAFDRLNKSYQKEFAVSGVESVRIENRFGQVNIENWDKPAIFIQVEVVVEHPSREKSERMLSAISVTIEQEGSQVVAVTSIDEKLMNSIGGNILGSSTKEIRIDYSVKMPRNLNLELSNRFGDVFINEITGRCRLNIKYGNLKANRLFFGNNTPISSLTLGYGNATIDEVDWFKLDVKYSSITINRARALAVLSKYSKFNVDQTSSVVVDSKYDNFNIGRVTNLIGESGYTNYRIERLEKKMDVTSRYGDVRIATVSSAFELIQFRGSYSSITAVIPDDASYTLEGAAAYGSITYGSVNRVSRIEGNTKVEVSGTVGGKSNPGAKVIVDVKYGNARLR